MKQVTIGTFTKSELQNHANNVLSKLNIPAKETIKKLSEGKVEDYESVELYTRTDGKLGIGVNFGNKGPTLADFFNKHK